MRFYRTAEIKKKPTVETTKKVSRGLWTEQLFGVNYKVLLSWEDIGEKMKDWQ